MKNTTKMITVEELLKRYSSTYRNKDTVFSYLLYRLANIAYKSSKLDEGFGIATLMLNLINSTVLFSGVPTYLTERIKDEITDDYYSETLVLLAKKHALDQKRQNNKREPSYICINKGVPCIFRSCPEDEGDEFILEEDTKFFNIDGIYKKDKEEEGGYYFE